MPRLNARGQAVSDAGGGIVSIDDQPIPGPSCGPVVWLDDDRIVYQDCSSAACVLRIYDVRTGTSEVIPGSTGANFLAAGGGRWVAAPSGAPIYGNFPLPEGAFMSLTGTDGRGAAGRDGTIALCPDESRTTVDLHGVDGSVQRIAAVAYGLTVISPTEAIWNGGALNFSPTLLPDARSVRVADVGGVRWVVYWTDRLGLVAHPASDTQHGVIIEPNPVAFDHDAIGVGPTLVVAYSTGQGEQPGQLVKYTFTGQGTVDLLAAWNTPRVAPYDRPFWCGYFHSWSDQYGDNPSAPGNCAIVVDAAAAVRCTLPVIVPATVIATVAARWASVVAIYVAAGDPAALGAGVSLARQAMASAGLAQRPILALRDGWPDSVTDAEWIGMELYCDPSESIDAFIARAHAGLATFDALPANRLVFFVVEAYDRNGQETDEAKLLALQAIWPELARDIHCVGVGLFSDGRLGGTRTHENLRPAHRAMVAAIPGVPAVVTIPPPAIEPAPVPPKPKPTPAPTPAPVLEGVDLMEFSKFADPLKEVLAVRAVKPHASRPGCSTLIKVDTRVVSIQPDGSVADRDPDTDGGYETCKVSGSVATFCPDGNAAHIYSFGFVVVDGLL